MNISTIPHNVKQLSNSEVPDILSKYVADEEVIAVFQHEDGNWEETGKWLRDWGISYGEQHGVKVGEYGCRGFTVKIVSREGDGR